MKVVIPQRRSGATPTAIPITEAQSFDNPVHFKCDADFGYLGEDENGMYFACMVCGDIAWYSRDSASFRHMKELPCTLVGVDRATAKKGMEAIRKRWNSIMEEERRRLSGAPTKNPR
ncbi:MAG: hypothetical protein JRN17_01570 [Nitrososphaerota archaeon]|nr:hypothetical protein [Nitrososphaerota archaeon]